MLILQSRIVFTPKDPDVGLLNWKQDSSRPEITFDDLTNSVEIQSSFKTMTDTAKIIIPRKLTWNKLPLVSGLQSLIQRGDKVRIELGYFTNQDAGLRTVFEGYVTKLVPNAPIIIHCEDTMFALKDILITYPSKRHLKTVTDKGKPIKDPHVIVANSDYDLNNLLEFMFNPSKIPFINLAGPVQMGTILWTNLSSVQVLDQLRGGDTLGACLYSYFIPGKTAIQVLKDYQQSTSISDFNDTGRPDDTPAKYIMTNIDGSIISINENTPVLCVGFVNNPFISTKETFGFERTIITDSELFYQVEKDINLTVIGKSRQRKQKNRLLEVKVGANDGNVITYWAPCDIDEATLKLRALKYLHNFSYTGYRGQFTTFGEPYLQPGDRAQLYSDMYPEKNGLYQVIGVNRSFGMNGYRQEIELGVQVGGTNFIPPTSNTLIK